MDNNQVMMEEMFKKSRAALKALESYTQEQIDDLIRVATKVVYENAESLAKDAVEETGMGKYEDKVIKNTLIPANIYMHLKGKKAIGEIKREPEKGLIHYAKPKGVISAVIPTTNPVITPYFNAMVALKGRNTIIMAPHPRAKKISLRTVNLMNAEMKKLGAPDNIIQVIAEPSIESTQMLMKTCDVILATGGSAMVKAAYSSGKPAYGVGPGNVQVLIDRDADIELAAQQVIFGKTFDMGILCACEQSIIVPKEMEQKVIDAFVKNGTYYISDEATVSKFRDMLFPEGVMDGKVVGQTVQFYADRTGVKVPEGTRMFLLKPKGVGKADLLCGEKMASTMIILTYDKWEDAVAIAKENLLMIGAGHTAVVYSQTDRHIEYAGNELPVGRVVVNQVGFSVAGMPDNGITPTCTLGCGSWGNNSISENLDYIHLINTTLVSYKLKQPKVMPEPKDLFAK